MMRQTEPTHSVADVEATLSRSALPDGELLSALADGELGGGNVAAACGAYAATAESAARWHAYHLIGDVLRSDDLACRPGRDSALLDAVRAQLAAEPVVLAPVPDVSSPLDHAPLPDSRQSRALEHRGLTARLARWGIVPSAMAAGFALVAAGLLTARFLAPTASPDSLQARVEVRSDRAAVERVAVPVPAIALQAEPQMMLADSSVVRDARVDRYLAAHQQFAGTSALAVPAGFLRNVTVDAPR